MSTLTLLAKATSLSKVVTTLRWPGVYLLTQLLGSSYQQALSRICGCVNIEGFRRLCYDDGTDMEINVLIDEGLEVSIDAGWLQSVAEQVLVAQGVSSSVELGLLIAGGGRVRQLNRSYRGRDESTDVLAFAMLPEQSAQGIDLPPFVIPPDGVRHLGEVIISYPQAVIQAEEHQHSVKREIAILIIHGILHLLGYEHDKPVSKRRMTAREAETLNYIEKEINLS